MPEFREGKVIVKKPKKKDRNATTAEYRGDEVNEETLAAAFAEWHRRWVEEPARFESEAHLLRADSGDYGIDAARYLLGILAEPECVSASSDRGKS